MQILVHFHSYFKDLAGCARASETLPDGSTLDDLYQLLKQDQNNRLMLILELTIVLLFIIDLVILVMGLK